MPQAHATAVLCAAVLSVAVAHMAKHRVCLWMSRCAPGGTDDVALVVACVCVRVRAYCRLPAPCRSAPPGGLALALTLLSRAHSLSLPLATDPRSALWLWSSHLSTAASLSTRSLSL